MEDLHWPLSVLTRCIYYKNISGAADNIGLSQPQISRLIKKIENELDIILLDRSSPRHIKWTKNAWKLVEIYNRNTLSLENSLNQLKENQIPSKISIGSLEGLIPKALEFVFNIQKKIEMSEIFLDIYDQNEMESLFLINDLDIIFTSRVPGKVKPKFIKNIGYQSFEHYQNKGLEVLSPFEYKTKSNKKTKKLISNSLTVRQLWLKQNGGIGQIPGPVKKFKTENDAEVLVVALDTTHPKIWQLIEA